MPSARTLVRRPAPALLTALLALLASLALTVVLATTGALPAQAHDRLVGSEPADGAALDDPPAAIALTFNTEPLDVEPQVVVTDSAGTVVAEGAPTIDGSTATLALDDAALGGDTYAVAWRVVSSDGHPIEGTFTFDVADQPEPSPTETAEETSEPSPTTDAPTTDAATDAVTTPGDDLTANGAASSDEPGNGALPIVLGAVAVLAVAGVATVLVLRRRGDGTPQDPQA